jgi:polyhydroxybutyrate depolymerase
MFTNTFLLNRILTQYWRPKSKFSGKTLLLLILLLLAGGNVNSCFGAVGASGLPSGNYNRTITVGNMERTFHFHIPPRGASGAPLLILFHGGGGTGLGIERDTNMNYYSDTNGFVSVYPDGYKNHWDDGRIVPARPNVDDVAFVVEIINHLQRELGYDQAKIYAVGYSDGGLFTQRLTFVLPGQFAAAAMVCAPENTVLVSQYGHGHPPTPVLFMLGTSDPNMPWFGGGIAWGSVISANATVNSWVRANECRVPPLRDKLANVDPSDGCRAELDYYEPGPHGNDVAFYRIIGGGHTWPGGTVPSKKHILGNTCEDFSASKAIWDFLTYHRRHL